MTNYASRLLEIAQRLDEISGDGASELQALSNELGEIADAWPDDRTTQRSQTPDPGYLRELDNMLRHYLTRLAAREPNAFRDIAYRAGAARWQENDRVDALLMSRTLSPVMKGDPFRGSAF